MSHQERVREHAGPAPTFSPMRTWRATCDCGSMYVKEYNAREQLLALMCRCGKRLQSRQIHQ